MRTAIEQAGAERGLLIGPRDDELQIEAEATTKGEVVRCSCATSVRERTALPESLVRYVLRTQETVILDDASLELRFPRIRISLSIEPVQFSVCR